MGTLRTETRTPALFGLQTLSVLPSTATGTAAKNCSSGKLAPGGRKELADLCALSRSQFMLSFLRTLGMTSVPPARHRASRWPAATAAGRARDSRGCIEPVRSAAAFSRAYSRAFGQSPVATQA